MTSGGLERQVALVTGATRGAGRGIAVDTHIITSWFIAPLMVRQGRGLMVGVTDGDPGNYHDNLFYDLAKKSVMRGQIRAVERTLSDRFPRHHTILPQANGKASETISFAVSARCFVVSRSIADPDVWARFRTSRRDP